LYLYKIQKNPIDYIEPQQDKAFITNLVLVHRQYLGLDFESWFWNEISNQYNSSGDISRSWRANIDWNYNRYNFV